MLGGDMVTCGESHLLTLDRFLGLHHCLPLLHAESPQVKWLVLCHLVGANVEFLGCPQVRLDAGGVVAQSL